MRTNATNNNKASDADDAQSIDRERIERLADSDLPCAWIADLLLDVIDDVDADDNGGGSRR